MVRLLHRSKSTRELRAKNEVPIFDEKLFSSIPKEEPTRRRAATLISPPKYTVRQEVGSPSPSLLSEWGNVNKKQETSYDIYMDSFLPRSASRDSRMASTTAIGIAIGSPTEETPTLKSLACVTPDTTGHFVSRMSFRLPPEPFDIGELGGRQTNKRGGQQNGQGGWRKLFGRGFFGSKKGPLASPKDAPVQPRHNPAAISGLTGPPDCGHESTAGATLPVNKLSKGFTQGSDTTVSTQETSPPSPHLLNVQIPVIEMERYSVMFQALVPENTPQESSPVQKTTLYHRRILQRSSSDSISKVNIIIREKIYVRF